MIAGIIGCLAEYLLYGLGILHLRGPMAANIWMAVWGFVAGLTVTVTVTYCTKAPDPGEAKRTYLCVCGAPAQEGVAGIRPLSSTPR